MRENDFTESEINPDSTLCESAMDDLLSTEETTPEEDNAGAEPQKAESNGLGHLTSSVPRSAKAPAGVLTKQQMSELREIFANMDDTQIQRLYKRVTKNN